jgi:hypothetical protein
MISGETMRGLEGSVEATQREIRLLKDQLENAQTKWANAEHKLSLLENRLYHTEEQLSDVTEYLARARYAMEGAYRRPELNPQPRKPLNVIAEDQSYYHPDPRLAYVPSEGLPTNFSRPSASGTKSAGRRARTLYPNPGDEAANELSAEVDTVDKPGRSGQTWYDP